MPAYENEEQEKAKESLNSTVDRRQDGTATVNKKIKITIVGNSTFERMLVCSVEFILLEWGFDIQLSGHSYNSREERSPKTDSKTDLQPPFQYLFMKDQSLQRIFLYTSTLYSIIF